MPTSIYKILAVFMITMHLSGCGFFHSVEQEAVRPLLGGDREAPRSAGPDLHATIPAPNVPPELSQKARSLQNATPNDEKQYTVTIECSSPDEDLCELFEKASRLAVMNREGEGRTSLTTLEQRLRVSVEQDGQDILHSQGYYDGQAAGTLEPAGENTLKAVVKFTPGQRYHVGATSVILTDPLEEPAPTDVKPPPTTLAEVGLNAGDEARASAVLAAVNQVTRAFRNRGYPRAQITATRYTLEPPAHLLDADVWIKPRAFARMGDIKYQGKRIVDDNYLKAYRTWKIGQPWNQDLVEQYLTSLRQSGLFQTVEGGPDRQREAGGLRPVWLRLTEAPPRTIGGMLSYDTDFGPGVTGYWEHRNLTGHGDRLRLDMPLWADLQQFTASYRYPFFLDPKQDFIARGGVLHQDTDAYKLWSAALSAGIERRISRRWKVSALGAVEGGALTDPGEEKKEFFMLGLPISATYDNANSIMDPTRGQRLIFQVAPYTGTYKKTSP
ncbi:hypothetical protein C4J81_14320 [Deltaproteobacteria bacterium Smac51]|nr:hypothetical protein C4J81_14320 [Deltaproteobacteria bacterium Smac51]